MDLLNLLQNLFMSRLDDHKNKRTSDEGKRDHRCLQWVEKSIQMAANMMLLDHAKLYLKCLEKISTLLNLTDFFDDETDEDHCNN